MGLKIFLIPCGRATWLHLLGRWETRLNGHNLTTQTFAWLATQSRLGFWYCHVLLMDLFKHSRATWLHGCQKPCKAAALRESNDAVEGASFDEGLPGAGWGNRTHKFSGSMTHTPEKRIYNPWILPATVAAIMIIMPKQYWDIFRSISHNSSSMVRTFRSTRFIAIMRKNTTMMRQLCKWLGKCYHWFLR